MTEGGAIKVHTHTAPPPVAIDAGSAPVIDAAPAPIDSSPVDSN